MNPLNHLNTEHRPPAPGPRYPITRVTVGDSARMFTILAETLFGLWTHWTGRTSMPCLNHGMDCSGCRSAQPKRWKGYLHSFDHEKKDECFLELTPAACQELIQQAGREKDLRGLRLHLRRTKGGKHGRLNVQVLPAIGDNSRLPPARSPILTLSSLWGPMLPKSE